MGIKMEVDGTEEVVESKGLSRFLKAFGKVGKEDWVADESGLQKLVKLLEDSKDDPDVRNAVKKVDIKAVTNLLVAYRARCTDMDFLIFDILSRLELFDLDMSNLLPLVFGEASRRNYENLRKMGLSLHVRIKPNDAIKTYFEPQTLWNTAKYHVKPVSDENADKIYDVRFVLRFFYSMLEPGAAVSCKLFVEHNCLALLFSCTSSTHVGIRSLAFACLQKYINLLQELKTEVFEEKPLIFYLIRLFKQSFDKFIPKIASVVSHFFARVSKLMLTPENPVYPQIMAFLCMKPIFDVENVPELYKLLFSSSPDKHDEEREWILTLISEAMLEPYDYQILQNRAGIKLLLTTFSSNWSNRKTRLLILRTLQNAVQLPPVAHDLFFGEALHTWITSCIDSNQFSKWEKNYLAQIFVDLLESERKYQRGQKGKDNACKVANSIARICSKKVLHVLRDIATKTDQFVGEQEKAKVTIGRIENVFEKKWKMKKKYMKI